MLIDTNKMGLFQEIIVRDYYGLRALHAARKEVTGVLDIGANYGWFAIMAHFLFPKARIVCIEPHEPTFKGLQKNIENLGITAFCMGLGTGSRITTHHRNELSGSVYSTESETGVPSYPLNEILEKTGFTSLDGVFLKVDCEGAERHILFNQRDLDLAMSASWFVAETHFQQLGVPDLPPREKFLEDILTIQKSYPNLVHTARDCVGKLVHLRAGA